MDAREIYQLTDEATFEMENSTCDKLMNLLNFVEYVVIEDVTGNDNKKNTPNLFQDLFFQCHVIILTKIFLKQQFDRKSK